MKSYFITTCYTFKSSILARLWLQLTPQLKGDFKLTHWQSKFGFSSTNGV